jgi:hypothetical protein
MEQIKDPFKRAQAIEIDNSNDVALKFGEIARELGRPAAVPLITTNAKHKTHVKDSDPNGVCEMCKEKVWLAPSSREHLRMHSDLTYIICFDCLKRRGVTVQMIVASAKSQVYEKIMRKLNGSDEEGEASS